MAFVTIGIEVHAQLLTRSKLFCRCPNSAGREPNTLVCPVCLGLPGTLPVLNKKAVAMVVATGKALHCTIASTSRFARKNYFYPDLPKNYQISQYEQPLCHDGFLPIQVNGKEKKIRIRRIHLEEDAGRLIHLPDGKAGVDFNRAGAPLMEIVTEPDMTSVEEAIAYLQMLKLTLQYLNVCTGNMEEGHLRVEPNVSVRLNENDPPGTKVELKNINSFKFAQKALNLEIQRQTELLKSKKPVVQETRRYDEKLDATVAMRSKEEESDYRYFPEPDLLPLYLPESFLEEPERQIPEMPFAKGKRLVETYGISEADAKRLIQEPAMASFFEQTARFVQPRLAIKFILNELQREIYERRASWQDIAVKPEAIAEIITRQQKGLISSNMAKTILSEIWSGEKSVDEVVQEKELSLISSKNELVEIAASVVSEHPEVVQNILNGKEKSIEFLVGQIMRKTKGKADPKEAHRVIRETIARRQK